MVLEARSSQALWWSSQSSSLEILFSVIGCTDWLTSTQSQSPTDYMTPRLLKEQLMSSHESGLLIELIFTSFQGTQTHKFYLEFSVNYWLWHRSLFGFVGLPLSTFSSLSRSFVLESAFVGLVNFLIQRLNSFEISLNVVFADWYELKMFFNGGNLSHGRRGKRERGQNHGHGCTRFTKSSSHLFPYYISLHNIIPRKINHSNFELAIGRNLQGISSPLNKLGLDHHKYTILCDNFMWFTFFC